MLEMIVIGFVLVMFAYVAADRAVSVTGRSPEDAAARAGRFSRFELTAYGALVVALAGSAVTGFAGYLMEGSVRGVLLIGHMLSGGLFAVALPVFLLVFAETARLDRQARGPLRTSEKALFWLACLSGGVSLATITLTMVPILATHAMETMMVIHRYSGLVMVVLAAPHVYIMNWSEKAARAAQTGSGRAEAAG
jgi:hypothetical protein